MSPTVPNTHTAMCAMHMRMTARLASSVPSGLQPGSENVCLVPDCDHVVDEEVPGAHFHINVTISLNDCVFFRTRCTEDMEGPFMTFLGLPSSTDHVFFCTHHQLSNCQNIWPSYSPHLLERHYPLYELLEEFCFFLYRT